MIEHEIYILNKVEFRIIHHIDSELDQPYCTVSIVILWSRLNKQTI